jgi:predicted Fe-Mo cluster-binding NifX family protein
MTHPSNIPPEFNLPSNIGNPATRALLHAGIQTLADASGHKAADLLALHGVGPKAVRLLREALAAKGLAFKGECQE